MKPVFLGSRRVVLIYRPDNLFRSTLMFWIRRLEVYLASRGRVVIYVKKGK